MGGGVVEKEGYYRRKWTRGGKRSKDRKRRTTDTSVSIISPSSSSSSSRYHFISAAALNLLHVPPPLVALNDTANAAPPSNRNLFKSIIEIDSHNEPTKQPKTTHSTLLLFLYKKKASFICVGVGVGGRGGVKRSEGWGE